MLEVVTRLGDSIIDVAHIAPPARRGLRTAVAFAAVALGLACLVVAAASFAGALRTADEDADAYAEWVATSRPVYAFRAHISEPIRDVTTLVCAGLGVVLLAFGLPRMRRPRAPRYCIGTSSFPIAAIGGDRFALHVAADEVVEVEPGTTASARLGAATVAVAVVEPARHHAFGVFGPGLGRFSAYLGGALAGHLVVLALLLTIVPEGDGDYDGVDRDSWEPLAVTVMPAADEASSHNRVADDESDPAPAPSMSIAAIPGSARATEDPSIATPHRHSAMLRGPAMPGLSTAASLELPTSDQTGASARGEAIESARSAGILGQAETIAAAVVDTTGATDALYNGFDVEHAAAGLAAANGEPPAGLFGTTRQDFGDGGWGCGCMDGEMHSSGVAGGGSGWGTIGVGPYGTTGRVPADSLHSPLVGRGDHVPVVTDAPFVTMCGGGNHWRGCGVRGDRDKAMIRRYLRRHLTEFEYCYEREHMSRPSLAGSLALQFVILSDGHVVNASAPGFDEHVGHCVADITSHIEFPSVKDDGATQVNYPLTFRAP